MQEACLDPQIEFKPLFRIAFAPRARACRDLRV